VTNDPSTAPNGPAPEARTYSEILSEIKDDPFVTDGERIATMADSTIGHAVTLLYQRGERATVELILDVDKITPEYDPQYEDWTIWLEVTPEQRSKFTENLVEKLRQACEDVCQRYRYIQFGLNVRETLPDVGPGWRDQLREQLAPKRRPTNQGRRARTEVPRFREDWLAFTNEGEQTVYRALRHIQEKELPADSTIGIYPLAGGRVPNHTWEPDFLITYKGRAGVFEVDGPHHNGRRAMDTTRDHLLRDAGVAFVDRVPVEVVENPSELHAVLRRFLRRLSETP